MTAADRRADGSAGGTARAVDAARTILRWELRRTWRGAAGDRRGQLLVAVSLLVVVAGARVTLGEAHAVGSAVARGRAFGLLGGARRYVGYAGMLLVALFGLRTVASLARPDNLELLATTVPSEGIVGGLLGAEYVKNAAVIGGFVAVHAAAFGVGAGTPAVALAATAATLLLLAATLLLGYVLGLAVVLGAERTTADANVIVLGGVAAAALGVALIGRPGGAGPVALYGEFFLAGSPLRPGVTVGHLAVAAGLVAMLPLLAGIGLRLAPRAWAAEPGAGTASPVLVPARPPVAPRRPAVRVGWLQWVRAARAPVRLSHAFYLGLLLVPPAMTILLFPGLVTPLGTGIAVLAGAWLAGGAFALNPVDDEGPALPVVLLAERSPATFVRGRVLAGAVPGAALVAGSVVATPLLGGDVAAAAATVAVGAAALAAGAGGGAALGFFAVERADLGSGPRPEVPNPFVVVVYTAAVAVAVAVPLGALLAPDVLESVAGVPAAQAPLLGLSTLLSATVAGPLGYRYAVRALADHRLS